MSVFSNMHLIKWSPENSGIGLSDSSYDFNNEHEKQQFCGQNRPNSLIKWFTLKQDQCTSVLLLMSSYSTVSSLSLYH